MAVYYWDPIAGNDTTGDGTAGNPYLTLNKATTGLTGGDEARCIKGPANTSLASGASWQWTDGGTTVTIGDGSDHSGEVAQYEFIVKDSNATEPWEVASVSYANPTTTITLYGTYSGTTQATPTSKLGAIDCSLAASSTQWQVVNASGSSTSSRLKLSFGWNSSGVRDGFCWFRQRYVTTPTNRNGISIYAYGKNYVEVDGTHAGFLRFSNCGPQPNMGVGWLLTNIRCAGSGSTALYLVQMWSSVVDSPQFTSNATAATAAFGCGTSVNITINNMVVKGWGRGIANGASHHVVFSAPTFRRLSDKAIYAYMPMGSCTVVDGVFDYVTSYLASMDYGPPLGIVLVNPTWTNCSNIVSCPVDRYSGYPEVGIQAYSGSAADHRWFFEYGTAQSNTADARSGACWKFSPTSTTIPIHSYNALRTYAAASADKELSIYLKRSGIYTAGDVVLEAYDEAGRLVAGPTTQTVGTSYGRHTLTIAAASLPRAQVVELRVLVKRQAGTDLAVYADDLMAD